MAIVIAVAVPVLVLAAILGPHLSGGDSGQWVMLARAYQGSEVPAYRDPFAVPPAAPLLTLGFLEATGDPLFAPKLALLTAYAVLALGIFVLSREMWGWLPAVGVTLIAGVGQNLYLRLAVFGALPQLLAVAAFAFALAAAVRHAKAPTRGTALALALAAGAILASHTPTAALALPILGLVLLLLPPPPRLDRAGLRFAAGRVAPVVPAAALFLAYAWHKRAAFDAYLTNEATFYVKGLGTALAELMRLRPTTLMLLAGGAVLLLLLARGALALRPDPRFGRLVPASEDRDAAVRAAVVLGVPALALGVIAVVLHLARIGTDYPRIVPLLALPLLVGLGVLAPRPGGLLKVPRPLRTAALTYATAGLLLMPIFVVVAQGEERAIPFYSLRSPHDLSAALAVVDARAAPGDAVWSPVREGKWLEGVTGHAALFGLPSWAIFRPWEWERKAAAETLATGSSWASTGSLAAMFQGEPSISSDNPAVRTYYKGDLKTVLRLREAASEVGLLRPGGADAVSFAALDERTEAMRTIPGGIEVEQVARGTFDAWTGDRVRIELRRTATLLEGGSTLSIVYALRSDGTPLEGLAIALRPAGAGPWDLETSQGKATLTTRRHAQPLALDMSWNADGPATLEAGEAFATEGMMLRFSPVAGSAGPLTEVRATLVLAGRAVGAPTLGLQALTAAEAIEEHQVRWALLPREGWDTARHNAVLLGFTPVHENPTYTLYHRPGGLP